MPFGWYGINALLCMKLLFSFLQYSDMPDTGIVSASELIQINATMIAGILIFYTIPYITAGGDYWDKGHWSENIVLGFIASAIGLFALSSILAFMASLPFNIDWSYFFTVIGFIAIAFAAGIFIVVVKMAKKRKTEAHTLEVVEQTPMAGEGLPTRVKPKNFFWMIVARIRVFFRNLFPKIGH
jgi:hypothetical protein